MKLDKRRSQRMIWKGTTEVEEVQSWKLITSTKMISPHKFRQIHFDYLKFSFVTRFLSVYVLFERYLCAIFGEFLGIIYLTFILGVIICVFKLLYS